MIPAVFALGLATGIALTTAFALGLLPLLLIWADGHEFSGRDRLLCDWRLGPHCATGYRKALSVTWSGTIGGRALNNRRREYDDGEQLMPLSTLLPFALIAVIGIVVFYAAYRAGAWA